jgi:NAD(P)-dependent dehydrogenase (short-subunit alcohol dehydrogenase family)
MILKGRTVIVTGAGSGLGRAFLLRAAEEGACVFAADIDEKAAQASAEAAAQLGAEAAACMADVCSAEGARSMVEAAVGRFGRVDSLVCSAGVFSSVPFLELTEKEWDRMLGVNVKGAFLCAQAFIRHLLKFNCGGSLLFISSISGYVGFAKSAHYCASKGAVRQLSKAIALEFAPHGIRSNVIAPGTIETPMNDWIFKDPDMYRKSVESIPAGRFGKSEEVANAGVFLLSDYASYCTGAELLVDGGQITHC